MMNNLDRIMEMQLEGKLEQLDQDDANALIQIAETADTHDSELPMILLLAVGFCLGVIVAAGAAVAA